MKDSRGRTIRLVLLVVLILLVIAFFAYSPLGYEYPASRRADLPEDFATYFEGRLTDAEERGVRPGNEPRLVRFAPKTELAILYIHGFGVSPPEGIAVVEDLSARFQANTYYMLLPGHGANMDDHASVTYADYVAAVEDAFFMTKKLGDRVVIMGSSTGALLATYLAAEHPDEVHALIIGSPLFEFASPLMAVFDYPGGLQLVHAMEGEVRDARWKEDPENRKQPGYEDYWLVEQKYSALIALTRLRRYVVSDATFGRIEAPTLLFYYYRDEEHQDQTVDVQAMLDALSKFGQYAEPHPLNRAVAVSDGHHILFSEYVRTDKELIKRESARFLEAVITYDASIARQE